MKMQFERRDSLWIVKRFRELRRWGREVMGLRKRRSVDRTSGLLGKRGLEGWSGCGVERRALIAALLLLTVILYKSEIRRTFGMLWDGSAMRSSGGGAGTDFRGNIGDVADNVVATAVPAKIQEFQMGPVEWKGDDTHYLLYYPLYGQLNNQLISLLDALVLAKKLGAVLVIPKVGAGFDSRFTRSSKDKEGGVYIVGDYFDWNSVARLQGIISVDDFVKLDVAKKAAASGKLKLTPTFNSRTLAKEKAFPAYNDFFKPEERSHEETDSLKKTIQKDLGHDKTKPSKCQVWYDLMTEAAKRDEATNGKLYLMSCMYQTIADDWKCHEDMPYWYELRKHLIPIVELRRSIGDMYRRVKRPLLAVHVRLLFKEEVLYKETLHELIRNVTSIDELSAVRTIYLAFGNREFELMKESGALEYLQEQVKHATVITCSNMENCAGLGDENMTVAHVSDWAEELRTKDEASFDDVFRSHYSATLLDMWALVNSDLFVGRRTSTLSLNVGYWRVAFETPEAQVPTRSYGSIPGPSK